MLFHRPFQDRRPLEQDLPVQVETLGRLVAFLLKMKEDYPEVTEADFDLNTGRFKDWFLQQIAKANQEGYARITPSASEPDIQEGFVLLTVMRGFSKPKKEIDAHFAALDRNRRQAEKGAGAAAAPAIVPAFTLPGAPRTTIPPPPFEVKRKAPPKRNVMPELVTSVGPLRRRTPPLGPAPWYSRSGSANRSASARRSASRTPPPPPPFGGGETASVVSVGQESSLTRLLSRVGKLDSMSELWTVNCSDLRKLFPEALKEREPQVVVAEMSFGGGALEPEVVIEDP